jgi:hypothetical protein
VTFEVLLCRLSVDPISYLHEVNSVADLVRWYAGLYCYIASVQIHMSALDAFDTHRPESGKILSKSHRDHHLCKLSRTGEAHNLMSVYIRGIGGNRATFCAYGNWNFESSFKMALLDPVV